MSLCSSNATTCAGTTVLAENRTFSCRLIRTTPPLPSADMLYVLYVHIFITCYTQREERLRKWQEFDVEIWGGGPNDTTAKKCVGLFYATTCRNVVAAPVHVFINGREDWAGIYSTDGSWPAIL
jgi:hypothetical protein